MENSFAQAERLAAYEDVQSVEQEHGLALPEDYKAHILKINGGYPQRDTFPLPGDEPRQLTVNAFYPVRYGEDTLEDALDDLRDQLHPDLVPFADDAGGDQFCLSVGPEDYGSVYYVAHEFYKPPKKAERKQPRQYGAGVLFLAPSFTAFLDGLVEVPDPA